MQMVARYKYVSRGGKVDGFYSGHKMISGNKRTRKQMEVKEVEE